MREDIEFLFIILFLSFPFTPILVAYWFLFPADVQATAYIKTTATEASGKSTSPYTIKKSALWWCTFTTPRSALGIYNHFWRGTSTRWVGFKKHCSAWCPVGESLSKTVRRISCHQPTSFPALQDIHKMGKGQFWFVQHTIKMHKRWLTWRNCKCGKLNMCFWKHWSSRITQSCVFSSCWKTNYHFKTIEIPIYCEYKLLINLPYYMYQQLERNGA